jgi:hypothetical protein
VIALAPLANRHIDVIQRYPAGRRFTARAGRAEDYRRAVLGERRPRVALSADGLLISQPRFCGPSYPTREREPVQAGGSGLEAAVPRAGGVYSERLAGRNVEVGRPYLEVFAALVATDVDVALALIDERLPGRIGAARAARIIA